MITKDHPTHKTNQGVAMRIAILEDDQDQGQIVQLWLEDAGHNCTCYSSAKSFMGAVKCDSYDLLLMDWELPESSGVEVLRWLRSNLDWDIPVLFTTQRDEESSIVEALEAGADDYMVKPLKRLELIARLTALARRSGVLHSKDPIEVFGRFTIDSENQKISLDETTFEVTHKEYELACFLFHNAGRVISRGHILESVWGSSADLNTRKIDTHVSRIRNKLDIKPENGWRITAVYQHGYRLEKVEEEAAA